MVYKKYDDNGVATYSLISGYLSLTKSINECSKSINVPSKSNNIEFSVG